MKQAVIRTVPGLIGLALCALSVSTHAVTDFEVFDPERAGVTPDVTIPNSPNPGGDAVVIDVAVVYSSRFRQLLESRGAYRADYILRSFDEVNRYLRNTGLQTHMEVVGLMEWALPTGGDLIADQQSLIELMESRTAARDEFSADLVQLMEVPEPGIDDPAICGWGQLIGPDRVISTSGFGYTAVAQGKPNTAFAGCYANATPLQFARIVAHELGHNLGSTHAWGEGGGEGAFAFAHGKLCGAPRNSFPEGTLMSISGYALDFFSNPLLREDGEACGVPQGQPNPADNRETFTRTASFIAGLRNRHQGPGRVTAVVPSDIGELNGSLPVVLVRNEAQSRASLELLVFEQEAINGEDFIAPARQIVRFASGQTSVTVQIPLVQDNQTEGAEGLLIFLQRPVNFQIFGERAYQVDIQDGLVEGISNLIEDAADSLPPTGSGDSSGSGTPPPADGGGSGGGGGGSGSLAWPMLLAALLRLRARSASGRSGSARGRCPWARGGRRRRPSRQRHPWAA